MWSVEILVICKLLSRNTLQYRTVKGASGSWRSSSGRSWGGGCPESGEKSRVVVLVVGGVILVVLNIFNLRERKYEIGVLAAIGIKKRKIALQFVCELFCVTLVAFMIGTTAGACLSVPVTNQLLANQAASSQSSQEQIAGNFGKDPSQMMQGQPDQGMMGSKGERPDSLGDQAAAYVDSVTSATDLTVVLQLVGVGILLTIVSSLAAIVTITRYEPLKILSSRT